MEKVQKRYISYGIGIFFVLIVGGAGAFFLKPDSALGRLFLWKITCQAITKYPWGCDKGFAFAYGEAQEAYFPREIMPSGKKGWPEVRNMHLMNIWN